MSVSPQDFLKSGKSYAQSNTEIDKRNGISRIYYSAYHLLSRIFPKDPQFTLTPPKGLHKTYHAFLESHPANSNERICGIKLKQLYSRRVASDYELDVDLGRSDLAMQIATADFIFNKVEELTAGSTSNNSAS